MGAGSIIFNVVLGLLVVGLIACFAYGGFLIYQSTDIQPGVIVQTTFTGNVAFLTSALIGPKGELAAGLSEQDAMNMMYCDVPGSAGAYSSWYRPAGASSQYDPYTQASYTSFWNQSFSCDSDNDCATKPWLECGSVGNCWPGGSYSEGGTWSQGMASTYCCGLSDYMVCSFTSEDQITSGVCSLTSNSVANGPLYTCNTSTHRCVPAGAAASGVTSCNDNSDCSGVPAGVCNTLTHYCQPDYGEHVLINTPWLAEGIVTSVNNGTANVNWTRVSNLYGWSGPQLSWFPTNSVWNYQNCAFVAGSDPLNSASADNVNNQQATWMALGLGSQGIDVQGLPTVTTANGLTVSNNVWSQVDATLGYGWMGSATEDQTLFGLPILSQVPSASNSAWNLQAMSVSTNQLKRVPGYTIQNVPTSSTWNQALLASMTQFRCQYMADRPPHLQTCPCAPTC